MSSMDQGRRLEQEIASYFAANGYAARCNAFLTGRSGGTHEVDVLAEKSDALATYRVAVECKAWQQPIEKDVVSKLHYILGDLGLSKGIIVSLSGTRSGADRTAADLGIDIWGPDELRRHLGEAATAQLSVPTVAVSTTHGWGYTVRAPMDAALRAMRTSGKGRLNLRTVEQVVWSSLVWLPAYCVTLTVAQPETKRRRTTLRSTTFSNLYDAVAGTFLGPVPAPWEQLEIDRAQTLPASLRDSKVHSAIRKAHQDYAKVTSAAAIQRHAQNLAQLGVPVPSQALSIDQTSLVYLPFFVGVLEAGSQHRAVAVNARTGNHSPAMSALFTAHLPQLRAHFIGQ